MRSPRQTFSATSLSFDISITHGSRINLCLPGCISSKSRDVLPDSGCPGGGETVYLSSRLSHSGAVAYDHLRKDMRTFVPARIQKVQMSGQTFVRPQKFSVEKTLRDSFGVHSGEGTFAVAIRFNAAAAPYIREK